MRNEVAIDQEFLWESHRQRIALIKMLGNADAEETEIKLRLLVNECIGGIRDAIRDLPSATRYETSNETAAVKSPSQRFRDIEQELSELADWFGGGRKPRLRPEISNHAIAAMLGFAPFGKGVIAATKHNVTSANGTTERTSIFSTCSAKILKSKRAKSSSIPDYRLRLVNHFDGAASSTWLSSIEISCG